jgi:hypothetical protein
MRSMDYYNKMLENGGELLIKNSKEKFADK